MLLVIKIFSLILIGGLSALIGNIVANRFKLRVRVLEDLSGALELFETRVKYTYDTVADSFEFVADNMKTEASQIFLRSAENMRNNKNISAGDAFRNAIDEEAIFLDLTQNDVEIVKGLGTSLGQTDLEGQVKNVVLIKNLVNKQLKEATESKDKNYKLSRNMGIFAGLTIMIILI